MYSYNRFITVDFSKPCTCDELSTEKSWYPKCKGYYNIRDNMGDVTLY